MRKKIVTWVIVILIIGGVIGLRFIAKNKSKYIQVKTEKVQRGDIKSYLSITGDVESKNSKSYFGIGGKVKKVNVKLGDKVKKEDVLIIYDIPDLEVQVKQAKIQYENAVLIQKDMKNKKNKIDNKLKDLEEQINILKESKNLEDNQALQALKNQKESITTISDEQIKQRENSVILAKIALDSAENQFKDAKDKIIAEADGTITEVNVIDGVVDSGMKPAVKVEDLNNLKISASVGKYSAEGIKVGQEVLIKNKEKTYNGKVSFVNPAAIKNVSPSGEDTSLGIEVDISSDVKGLKIGFDVDVNILLSQAKNIFKIPIEAVKKNKEGENIVYTVQDRKAVEKVIETGIQSDSEIEIKKGLQEGEKVILNPGNSIENGTLVNEVLKDNKKV